jgi:hypothetical protein
MHQELYTVIKRKSAQILKSILPGLIVLEVVFDRGFFSVIPNDIYSFILFLIWAIFLSIPFHTFPPYDVDFFLENITKELYPTKDKEKKEEEYEDLYDEFHLGFVILNSLVFYLLIKLLNSYTIIETNFIDIPKEILYYTLGVMIVFISRVQLGKIYTRIVRYFVLKYFEKEKRYSKV